MSEQSSFEENKKKIYVELKENIKVRLNPEELEELRNKNKIITERKGGYLDKYKKVILIGFLIHIALF
jgi:hypothetical protein